jgi:serine/threonine protein kinase/WD40 repeat protein
MAAPGSNREKEIFERALDLDSLRERADFVLLACGADTNLLGRVQRLLRLHDQDAGFLADQPKAAGASLDAQRLLQLGLHGDAPISEKPGDTIGRYKLIERIGEGGCGVVYLAGQEEPVRRRVALKIIKPGMNSVEVISRFEAERQALALMDHPNIAKIFDGGATDTGRPYFVMELVRGIPVTEYCDDNGLPMAARLELFVQICQAVQHAHQKGIIHRDIKPSNVLVTVNDGVATPKIIDFGIAKATEQSLTDKTVFTRFHQFIGTPAYMSPEQAEMTSLDIDTRSDIYSLGVLLYELLVGRTPFDTSELIRAGLDELRRRIREEEPVKPSTRFSTMRASDQTAVARRRKTESPRLINLLRGDLDWVVMKSLEKDRTRRYATASAFAEDIRRHLTNLPVEASPPSFAYRARRFARRNRMLVTSATTVAVVIVAALIVSLYHVVVATDERNKAREAGQSEARHRNLAETNAAKVRKQLVRLNLANGVRSMDDGDWFGALLWFTETLRHEPPGSRGEQMNRERIGALLQYPPHLLHVWFHDADINTVAFSPDARWIVTASRDSTARLWDSQTGAPGPVFSHSTNVKTATFSGNNRYVLTVTDDGLAHVWNSVTGQSAGPPLAHGHHVTSALISPDGQRVFTIGDTAWTNFATVTPSRKTGDASLRIWDVAKGTQVCEALKRKGSAKSLTLSADAQWLAASFGELVMIWNLRNGAAIAVSGGRIPTITSIPALTPSGTGEATERLLPPVPLRPASLKGLPWINSVSFSPDNKTALIVCADHSVFLVSLAGEPPIRLSAPLTPSESIEDLREETAVFSFDNTHVLSVDGSGVARSYGSRTGQMTAQFPVRLSSPFWLSPDGEFVLSSGGLWEMASGRAISPRPLHSYPRSAAFSPDGASVVTVGFDGSARHWSLVGLPPGPRVLRHDWPTVSAHSSAPAAQPSPTESMRRAYQDVSAVAFSHDGRRMITGSWNGSARVWDSRTAVPVTPFVILDGAVRCVAFDASGSRVVTAGGTPPFFEQGLARVWDAHTGSPITRVIKHSHPFRWAAFSPDGRWLVTQDRAAAQLWDAATGAPRELPFKIQGALRGIEFSTNGDFAAVCVGLGPSPNAPSSSPLGQTRIVNLLTGQPTATLLDETNHIERMQFSPDGQWLITFARNPISDSGEEDNFFWMVRIWTVATGRLVSAQLMFGFSIQAVFVPGNLRIVLCNGIDAIVVELPSGKTIDTSEWRGLRRGSFAITGDGSRCVSVEQDEVRVVDSLTGDPLTPLLRKANSSITGLFFGPRGDCLAALADDAVHFFPLPREQRSVEELMPLAELLSGRKIENSGNYADWSPRAAMQTWQTLKSKRPDNSLVPAAEVREWREQIVAKAEREARWSTAVFHLDQLRKDYPAEESFRVRRNKALNQIAIKELQ